MSNPTPETPKASGLTRKDFLSKTDPRWCAGCGCFSAFNSLTSVFPNTGIPREKFAIISGIGCSSRLPYYADCYGFHTIHGRAPTIAAGVKLANPELSVWVVTGDGDALSIGGNHFLHLMRRNADIKLSLFNNQIYGLTKGQTSPTTKPGTKTKTTPFGNFENSVRPLALALAAGATFAARVPDTDGELLREAYTAAASHKGVAFIEILINCVIFNDGTYLPLTDKATKADTTLRLKQGEPMLFGADRNKGIRLGRDLKPEVVKIGENGVTVNDILVHDIHRKDSSLAYLLSLMDYPDSPVPLGIFRQVSEPVHEFRSAYPKKRNLNDLLCEGNAWNLGATGEISPVS